MARQNDGFLEAFPIWDDVRTFDGRPWRGIVDVVSGGFPCQDISCAGKGAGITGERSGLWFEMARIVGEVRPRFVFIENSPMLRTRGLNVVLKDLAEMGYDARWGVLGADDAGAPHHRKRIWILANTAQVRRREGNTITGGTREGKRTPEERNGLADGCNVSDAKDERTLWRDRAQANADKEIRQDGGDRNIQWWSTEPAIRRVVNGFPARVDRLKALGNAQVPAVAALAWTILSEGLI